jgi:hypothetical protein
MAATRFKTWALVAVAVFGWVLFFIAIGLQRRDDVLVRRLQASQANSWAELQNLRKATGLLASIKTTIDSANQELRQASADRDDAQAEANQARQRIAELRRETNEVEQAIKARKQELAGLQQESEMARQQTIEAQAELQRLQELATAKAAESDRSEQLVQAAQVRKGALDAELSRGDMRLAVLDRERAELEQALTELRSDRSTRASELQTISRQREVLQNENAGLADVLAAKKREAVELENRSHSTPQEADAKPKLDEVRFVPQDTVAARSPPDEEPDLRSEKLQSDSSASIAIPLPPPRPEGPIAPQERNPDHTGASLKDSVASRIPGAVAKPWNCRTTPRQPCLDIVAAPCRSRQRCHSRLWFCPSAPLHGMGAEYACRQRASHHRARSRLLGCMVVAQSRVTRVNLGLLWAERGVPWPREKLRLRIR